MPAIQHRRSRTPGRVDQSALPGDLSTDALVLYVTGDSGLYKDTAKTTPATADGDLVAAWADQSTYGNDLKQATSGNRPALKLSQVNGHNAVLFNGSSTVMDLTSRPTAMYHTIFAVANISSTSSGTIICGPNGALQFRTNTKQDMLKAGVTDMGAGSATLSTSTWYLMNCWYEMLKATGGYRLNGVADGSISSPQSLTDTLNVVGKQFTNNNEFFNGYIAALLVYARVLSTLECQAVETYLNLRYALY